MGSGGRDAAPDVETPRWAPRVAAPVTFERRSDPHMKAKMLLAEAATGHPDGTISMLRAGINQVWVQQPPFGLHASLVSRIEAELGDAGTHQFDLRCMNDDGAEVMPKM